MAKLMKKNPAKQPVKLAEDEIAESSALPAELKVGTRRIGVSKGLTINLGNYESARISYWMERVIPDSDSECTKAIIEMSELVENALEEEARELKAE